MYQSSDIRPSGFHDVFAIDNKATADCIRFHVKPVIFKVPERADRPDANLYIVVSGSLTFESSNLRSSRPLRTRGFATRIGYFRSKPSELQHVYGAHYDIEENQQGHPVFHGQIAPQMEFWANVADEFRVHNGSPADLVSGILRNVRVPTAQMDVFSVFIQICADHLIFAKSNDEIRTTFSNLKNSCNFFTGVAHRLGYLNNDNASNCYRSLHWYNSPSISGKV